MSTASESSSSSSSSSSSVDIPVNTTSIVIRTVTDPNAPVQAYENQDVEKSKEAHDLRNAMAPEKHGGQGSDMIKSIVFGGLDGIITTFSIVAAVAGASLSIEVVLLMGFANLIADAISMGLGDFLSELAEIKFERAERDREEWEMENYPEGEINEMINIYKEKGITEEDARTILLTMAKYRKIFVDHMMVMELDINPSSAEDANPAKNGFVTFCSFIAFGSVPVICYAIMYGAGYADKGGQFGLACLFTALTMFTLGAVQARITRQPIFKTGLSMMLNGSLAAAAAYLVGWGLEQAIGRGEC